MATMSVTASSKLVYKSVEGGAGRNDSISIRLAPGVTGTVYLQRSTKGTAATTTGSFYITDSEVYSATLVAGEQIQAIVASGTLEIRIDADDSGTFGS